MVTWSVALWNSSSSLVPNVKSYRSKRGERGKNSITIIIHARSKELKPFNLSVSWPVFISNFAHAKKTDDEEKATRKKK